MHLTADIRVRNLVKLAKIRWRIEHDYRELKDSLGLDHFEGLWGVKSRPRGLNCAYVAMGLHSLMRSSTTGRWQLDGLSRGAAQCSVGLLYSFSVD
ncbi:hypothetical protein ADK67_06360 [Saccharothrix sp. NRRL B-16348]|nr:hypothetical protein [Saccharothrix sp. NRRL B-16348]KOX33405.1 hypothetical protein ADK67_06360 [Saccharothrix sp. NRRL B-16348]